MSQLESLGRFSDEFTRVAESSGIFCDENITDFILTKARIAVATPIGSPERIALGEMFEGKSATLEIGDGGNGSQINLSQPSGIFKSQLPPIRSYTSQLLLNPNDNDVAGYFYARVENDELNGEFFRNQDVSEKNRIKNFWRNLSPIRITLVAENGTSEELITCNYGSIPESLQVKEQHIKGVRIETYSPESKINLTLIAILKQLRQKLRMS